MTVTVNSIRVDFHLDPPRVRFLQGAPGDIATIRTALRQIEESEEGRIQPTIAIIDAFGNQDFSEQLDGSKRQALAVRVLAPYVVDFEGGATPFVTSGGNFLASTLQSPGAIVKINNAVDSLVVAGSSSAFAGDTFVRLSVVEDGTTYRFQGHLYRDGAPVTSGLVGASVSVRGPDDDTVVLAPTAMTADARGVYRLTATLAGIVRRRAYYAEVTITDATGPVTSRYDLPVS